MTKCMEFETKRWYAVVQLGNPHEDRYPDDLDEGYFFTFNFRLNLYRKGTFDKYER
jgi:hypothetical protein